MRHWTVLLSSLFGISILALGLAAGWRMPPVPAPGSADLVSGMLAQQFESHYDEVFPAKTFGTNLWAALDYRVFREGRPGVVVGEQGWLYTNEEFKGYGEPETQIEQHLELIAWAREQLARHRVALVVAMLPAKARIYPEYRGARTPARLHADLYDRSYTVLQRADIPAPDLLLSLKRCKQQDAVFLRTDTHWTPAGARCAAQDLGAVVHEAKLSAARAVPYSTRTESVQEHKGDLMKFLPLDPYFADWLPPPDRIEVQRTDAAGAVEATGLLDEAPRPDVVLIGTSYSADSRWNFAGALQEALGEDVVSYAAQGQGPFIPMLEYLRSADLPAAPPRLVIWEIPERYLPMTEDLAPYQLPFASARAAPSHS